MVVAALSPNRQRVLVDGKALPRVTLGVDLPVWKSARDAIAPVAATCEILGWAGAPSTAFDRTLPPALAMSFVPRHDRSAPYRLEPHDQVESTLLDDDRIVLTQAMARFR